MYFNNIRNINWLKRALSVTILCLILSISGCNHFKHDHSSEHNAKHSKHHSVGGPEHDFKHPLEIVLKDNKKWLMDAHTRKVTQTMTEHIENMSLEQQSQEQLRNLGEQLSSDLDNLIQGCTMEGEAHNALHEFLNNFMPAVGHLKSEGKLNSAKRARYLLKEYKNYFE